MISAAEPTSVIVVGLTNVSVTPAPSTGVAKVPALAVSVTVIELLSISAMVAADRSTLLSVSSVTVTAAGRLDTVGSSFTALIEIPSVSATPFSVLSFGVTVRVAVVVSSAAVVNVICVVSFR